MRTLFNGRVSAAGLLVLDLNCVNGTVRKSRKISYVQLETTRILIEFELLEIPNNGMIVKMV
ncbi:MAG: hypothetical protein LBT09_07575, partial [Planctomycetaceae bacterium]|nr:hypothetical protein [Planctomycetaceae bacterium]MDR1484669.1 hypothetical protein [Planctomycetaceae bacterium]